MAVDKTKDINVGGTLHSIATGNVIVHADEVMDEAWTTGGKKQSDINQELKTTASSNLKELQDAIEQEKDRAEAAESDLQTALDTEIAARKAVDGQTGNTYAPNTSSNYIKTAKNLNEADTLLDAQIKKNADAIGVLNGGETTAGSVAKAIKDKIDSLDVTAIGEEGKYLKTVSETDGKIDATYAQVQASEVKNTSSKSQISSAATVQAALDALADEATKQNITAADKSVVVSQAASGTTVKVNIKSDEKTLKLDASNGLYTNLRINQLATPSSAAVREEYELLTTDGSRLGTTIKVYKDQTLLDVALLHAKGTTLPTYSQATGLWTDITGFTEADLALCYAYATSDGNVKVVAIPVGSFLRESEFKDGLTVSATGEVSVLKDPASESFLSVSAAGVKLSGVQNAINAAKTAEQERAEAAEADLAESIYYYHAEIGLTASPTLIEKGVATTINLTATSAFKGVGANSLKIANNTDTNKQLAMTGNTTRMTTTDSITDTTTYRATAVFPHNVTTTKDVTVTAQYPIYYFGSTSATVNSAAITAGTKKVASNAAGDYNITLAANLTYFWFCVPSNMNVSSATLSGFDLPLEAAVTVAVDGKGSYKCYRSSNTNDAGSYKVTLKA